jgi:osmotically inducible protein OsmC
MGIGHEIDRACVGVVTTSSPHRPGFHSQRNLFSRSIMNRPEKVIYTAKGHTTGGRVGSSRSDDGKLDVKLTRPGTSGAGTNPEQLFAAGWSACYESAMELVARRMKVALPADLAVDAEVDLGPNGAGYDVAVRLNVSLPGVAPDVAQRLIEATHEVCPYSRATHGNIAVATKLV